MTTHQPSDHWNRILNADLSYPILVHNGFVVDGMHRIAKAFITDQKITARFVTDEQMSECSIGRCI